MLLLIFIGVVIGFMAGATLGVVFAVKMLGDDNR